MLSAFGGELVELWASSLASQSCAVSFYGGNKIKIHIFSYLRIFLCLLVKSFKNMAPPIDRQIWEGEIATYWFDDGILVSLSKSTTRTVQTISRNVALVKSITNNKPVPLLIYLANSPVPDKETRKFSTEQLPVIYSAMAMVSKPGLSKFIMNILFSLKPPPIPMKSFTDDKEAKEWLRQFVK